MCFDSVWSHGICCFLVLNLFWDLSHSVSWFWVSEFTVKSLQHLWLGARRSIGVLIVHYMDSCRLVVSCMKKNISFRKWSRENPYAFRTPSSVFIEDSTHNITNSGRSSCYSGPINREMAGTAKCKFYNRFHLRTTVQFAISCTRFLSLIFDPARVRNTSYLPFQARCP